ncbi:uncharacterized protein BJ171DRAFT_513018 [Polychytrium aggregatum]|uniref:uncharacterized protein n=1 Tax=Polychytrium aggregatum TaxID=110093 RepID=UPI0022FE50BB|nr:uncharacterized protein BJ171DRAFT_513018 [Polychytrium aggregatum]KAI9202703.1 hypothetical protein BJ171DRAFT_513018 [Polychytrium aggregatum]
MDSRLLLDLVPCPSAQAVPGLDEFVVVAFNDLAGTYRLLREIDDPQAVRTYAAEYTWCGFEEVEGPIQITTVSKGSSIHVSLVSVSAKIASGKAPHFAVSLARFLHKHGAKRVLVVAAVDVASHPSKPHFFSLNGYPAEANLPVLKTSADVNDHTALHIVQALETQGLQVGGLILPTKRERPSARYGTEEIRQFSDSLCQLLGLSFSAESAAATPVVQSSYSTDDSKYDRMYL